MDGNVHADFFTVKGKYVVHYIHSGINYKTEPMKTHIERISERIQMDNMQCTKQWYTTRKMKWQIDTPCMYRAACIYHTVFSIHTHKANDFFLSRAFFSPPTKKTLHDSPRDIFLYCFFVFIPFFSISLPPSSSLSDRLCVLRGYTKFNIWRDENANKIAVKKIDRFQLDKRAALNQKDLNELNDYGLCSLGWARKILNAIDKSSKWCALCVITESSAEWSFGIAPLIVERLDLSIVYVNFQYIKMHFSFSLALSRFD